MERWLAAVLAVSALAGCVDGPEEAPDAAMEEDPPEATRTTRDVEFEGLLTGAQECVPLMCFNGQGPVFFSFGAGVQVIGMRLELNVDGDQPPAHWRVRCVQEGGTCGEFEVEGEPPLELAFNETLPVGATFESSVERTDRAGAADMALMLAEQGPPRYAVSGQAQVLQHDIPVDVDEETTAVEGTVNCNAFVEDPCSTRFANDWGAYWHRYEAGSESFWSFDLNLTWTPASPLSPDLVLEVDCSGDRPGPCDESWNGPYRAKGQSPVRLHADSIGLRPGVDLEVRAYQEDGPEAGQVPVRQDIRIDGWVGRLEPVS